MRILPKEIPENLRFDIKSIKEEIANMISHGAGVVLSLIGIPILLAYALDVKEINYFIGSAIYGISLIMMYTSSTLYHSTYKLTIRKLFQTFDHISIYFLIAGSYTPFILIHLNTTPGWTVLTILWCFVALGTIFKIFFVGKFRIVSTIVYLMMGWMAVFIFEPMVNNLPYLSVVWIVAGGISYTIGSIFYLWRKLPYNHLIWHLFVLGGSISHYIAILHSVVSS